MRPPKVPSGTEIIRTYAEYGELIDGFFRGCYQLLFIVGRPGLAKSYEFEQRLGEGGHLIKGWTAPMQAYIDAYQHRNQPLIFDDAEVLWKRPGGRILIRSLTEHRPKKLVQWKSTAKELAKAGVPQSFYTTSKIAIVANRFAFGSEEEREAVLDRGHLVLFDPRPLEVHQRVGDWFWCQEIYDYLGERLHMLDSHSARTDLKAWERHGLPSWCEYSNDPNDYADYTDYLADWWKRPQPPEPDESEDGHNPGDHRGDNIDWLRREMKKAIGRVDYERAAELREEIRKKEEGRRKDAD